MIEYLTQEQIDKLPVYRKKWIDIGTSTDPINVEKSLKFLKLMYNEAKLKFPSSYEIYQSPYEAINKVREKYNINTTINDFIFGPHEGYWLSYFNYFQEVLGLEECDRLSPLMELSKHCGWVLPFDKIIVLTDKPCVIKFDEQLRTHCEDDYAIMYRDGYGVASWHGTRIPPKWIFNKSIITPDVLLNWPNIEQRRCACEIVGWINVLTLLDAKLINEDGDPTVGTLYEVDLPGIGNERFLVAIDPNTNKKIGLPVPGETKTALEANSWTYGINKFEFKPDFRV